LASDRDRNRWSGGGGLGESSGSNSVQQGTRGPSIERDSHVTTGGGVVSNNAGAGTNNSARQDGTPGQGQTVTGAGLTTPLTTNGAGMRIGSVEPKPAGDRPGSSAGSGGSGSLFTNVPQPMSHAQAPVGSSQPPPPQQPNTRKSPTLGEKTDAASISLAGLSSGDVGPTGPVANVPSSSNLEPNPESKEGGMTYPVSSTSTQDQTGTSPTNQTTNADASTINPAFPSFTSNPNPTPGAVGSGSTAVTVVPAPAGNVGTNVNASPPATSASVAVAGSAAGTPAGGAAYRPLNVRDALSYLDQVKVSSKVFRLVVPSPWGLVRGRGC
jgi:hypothetical protein